MDGGGESIHRCLAGEFADNQSRPPSHVRIVFLSSLPVALASGPRSLAVFFWSAGCRPDGESNCQGPGQPRLQSSRGSVFVLICFLKCRFGPCGPVGLNCRGRGGVKGDTLLMKCRLLRISGRLLRVPLVLRLLPGGGFRDGASPPRCGCRVLPRQWRLHPANPPDPGGPPPGFTVIEV